MPEVGVDGRSSRPRFSSCAPVRSRPSTRTPKRCVAEAVVVGVQAHAALVELAARGSGAADAPADALPGTGDGALRLGRRDELPSDFPLGVAAEEVVDLVRIELVHVQDAVPHQRGVPRRHLLEPRDDRADRARRQPADGARRGSRC